MLGPIGAAPFLVSYVILVSAYALTWMLLCGLITLYGRMLDLFGTHHCGTFSVVYFINDSISPPPTL